MAEPKPNVAIAVLRHFWAPVPWMLEAAVLLQALIGEYLEAAVIAGLLVFNAALSFVQGRRAETALAALKTRLALTGFVLEGRLKTYMGSPRYDALPVKE